MKRGIYMIKERYLSIIILIFGVFVGKELIFEEFGCDLCVERIV